ncbi:CLUMA_CG014540, isoform A [Clunio marinus]|uniref:CLUMA_CG014540, isoform A n=1 Tax=Clunio marinus TaxID=568069 RepID=A0A1J1ILE8_9DIPT|nr:CLUMA_CG014540, isoform A [Clunio marinus]
MEGEFVKEAKLSTYRNLSHFDSNDNINCCDEDILQSVWQRTEQHPVLNDRIVNELMDGMDFDNNNNNNNNNISNQNFEDITGMLSSSFPSGSIQDTSMNNETEMLSNIVTSTPQHKHMDYSTADTDYKMEAQVEFNNASPIPFTSQNRKLKRRRGLNSEFDETLQRAAKVLKL